MSFLFKIARSSINSKECEEVKIKKILFNFANFTTSTTTVATTATTTTKKKKKEKNWAWGKRFFLIFLHFCLKFIFVEKIQENKNTSYYVFLNTFTPPCFNSWMPQLFYVWIYHLLYPIDTSICWFFHNKKLALS